MTLKISSISHPGTMLHVPVRAIRTGNGSFERIRVEAIGHRFCAKKMSWTSLNNFVQIVHRKNWK